ncbi:hypothetical protein BM221_009231 [Beauveria bassiana]|uniref:Uncharacterized protein n=1 Tax=Beauveria bassiana TaxID=176275 RepID=A0A2N6NCP0_BEABA|nr:hypothetical protein BM221_009231 [Beauveria bassiana]
MIELIPVSASATRARIYSMRAIVAIVATRVESSRPKESSIIATCALASKRGNKRESSPN